MNLESLLKVAGGNPAEILKALKLQKRAKGLRTGEVMPDNDLYLELLQRIEALNNRGYYYDVDPDLIDKLTKIPREYSVLETFDIPILMKNRPGKISNESQFSRMENLLLFLNLFNQLHNYRLNLDLFPRTHYEFDGTFGAYEIPIDGTKNLPTVTRGSGINDVMYANAHEMWNRMSLETKDKLERIYAKIWKKAPDSNGLRTPGERAFAVSKDIQTSLYERFMNDNRFTIKDYDEWCEYVDDIPDDVLRDLAKKVHGGNQYQNGYWYENGYIDTSDKGIEALRETLKYKKGGKAKLISKRSV